ncbi:DUF1194 domain-containing protein [Aestuariibius sp. 2305UL40-4]|uniref:DUF1194 domain-containing protein n=1 Tax=Aestuariibius violaceus TaxID=3234132 RepID=UPI00345E6709
MIDQGRLFGLCASALACLGLAAPQQAGAAECRQALALALDVSGSVDLAEYRLQRDGLAAALAAPAVRAALLSDTAAPVRIAVYEWSGQDNQRILSPFTEIVDDAALDALIARIEGTERRPADPATALGVAMQYGAFLLAAQPCWVRTLDVSGDGKANTGPLPQSLNLPADITVNALVISDPPDPNGRMAVTRGGLITYFEDAVIRGPGAFAEVAAGFADYERAMTRKLLREIESIAIGAVETEDDGAPS